MGTPQNRDARGYLTPEPYLTTGSIPLAGIARETEHYALAPHGAMLKCTAPSPQRADAELYDYGPCTEFLAKAYFEGEDPISEVCVIFNGMDETPHSLKLDHELFGLYDALGKKLARQGKLAILLPSPFHLNRSLPYMSADIADELKQEHDGGFLDMTRPSNALVKAPHNLYVNHYQSFRELISLCRSLVPRAFSPGTQAELEKVCPIGGRQLITRKTAAFLRNKLNSDACVSLIGYSMGGLRVMTAFCFTWALALKFNEEPLFTACVALNAGASFSGMNVPGWVNRASWLEMVSRLNLEDFSEKLQGSFQGEEDVFENYRKAIQDVTLGNALTIRDLEEQDAGFTRRLLFILGGSDDIMKLRALHRITPPGGLNIFHVAGAGHMFRHGQWGTQFSGMLDHVGNFVTACSREADALNTQDVVEFLSLVDWSLGVLPYNADMRPREGGPDALEASQSAVTEIHEKDTARIARMILCPVDVAAIGVDGNTARGLGGIELGAQVESAARDFVVDELLGVLGTRIEAGDCPPGLYRNVRRTLLVGWIVSENKKLVDYWTSMAGTDELIGAMLEEQGIAPKWLISRSLVRQQSLLEAIRQKMVRAFRRACSSEGILLGEPPLEQRSSSQT